MFGAALDRDPSVVFLRTVGEEQLKLVHPFIVPFEGPEGPVQFKCHFAARAFDHPAGFQMALGTIVELNQGTDIIFIGHGGAGGRPG